MPHSNTIYTINVVTEAAEDIREKNGANTANTIATLSKPPCFSIPVTENNSYTASNAINEVATVNTIVQGSINTVKNIEAAITPVIMRVFIPLHFLSNTAETAIAFGIYRQRAIEIFGGEIGPQHIVEHVFGISALPNQKIG